MFLRHIFKLAFRILLLATALYLYFTDIVKLNYPAVFQQGFGAWFLWLVWIVLVVDMLYRLIPNKHIAIGAGKHFACSYKASSIKTDAADMSKAPNPLHKGALYSAVAWLAATSAMLFALHLLGILTPPMVLIVTLLYAVFDLVFILFYCPFQALFWRNRCCVECRIYNWDYFMMCSPMLLFPNAYSISLVLLSVAVLLHWEIALRNKPHYFTRATNENLRCELCTDKLCLLRGLGKGLRR